MWQHIWSWITWINAQLRDVIVIATFISALATFCGVMYQIRALWQRQRLVTIVARNRESGERREIAKIPAPFVTRAEVMGLVAKAAGGEQLDFRGFAFDYKFKDQVIVELPAESFAKLLPAQA